MVTIMLCAEPSPNPSHGGRGAQLPHFDAEQIASCGCARCLSLPQAACFPVRGAGRYSPSLSAQCCDDAPQIALLPRRHFGVIMPNPLTIPIEQARAAALANPLPAVGSLAAGTITVLATDLRRLCGRSCAGAPVARL